MTEISQLIEESFKKYGFSLTATQVEQFEKYYQFLISENEKYNLTAITDMKEVVIKHFIDSALPSNEFKSNASVIDVGTGAGFPGVVLKILRPDIKLTLLDSLQKRISFLKQLADVLHLENITFVHARSEDYAKEKREYFDYATSRAVAALPTLSEYLLPFVKLGGKAVVYKGSKLEEELVSASQAIKILGGKVIAKKDFYLEEYDSPRSILIIEKISHTDKKYPRGKNLPRLKPLGLNN